MIRSVGFVGLGAMGSVMAPLPVQAGFNVIGFDPATTLNENSGVCSSSRLEELVSCDAVIFMLPNGKTVAKVATSTHTTPNFNYIFGWNHNFFNLIFQTMRDRLLTDGLRDLFLRP